MTPEVVYALCGLVLVVSALVFGVILNLPGRRL